MKKIYLLLTALLLCSITYAQNLTTNNKIVAFVNKRIITQFELNEQVTATVKKLKNKGNTNINMTDVQKQVLDQLILIQIQLDLAARSGIKTNDLEINNAIDNLTKSQNKSVEKLAAEEGMNVTEYKAYVRDQILVEKLKMREVDAKISINDDEINRVLSSKIYQQKTDYHIANILIGIPEQATQATINEKEALANKVLLQLKNGASFTDLALKYSSGSNAINGGDLGWKSSNSLPPIIIEQLQQTPKDGYTSIVKMPIGFLIFKLINTRKQGEPDIVTQYHVRHILIKPSEIMSDEEAHHKIQAIYQQLISLNDDESAQNQAFIKLAKQNSEDGSAMKGGDIGWVTPGDTVPQFEKVMIATKLGVISPPLKTEFGWHILEVTEKRDSNMANDKEKNAIRQELRDSKAQTLYEEWVGSLRDSAYVRINND